MLQDKMMNCMTVIVGKAVSASGRVLVAHNEDDPGHVIVRHAIVPAADHASGELIPAEKGLARIPQGPHTLGYYWVEYVEDDGGLTAADAYLNECGVVVTSNSMGWSKEDDDDPNVVKDGGIGYVLRRALALHRPDKNDVLDVLHKVGGLDIAAMTGAFLGCAHEGIAAAVDGYISVAAALCAVRLCPAAGDYLFLSHQSYELGYAKAAQALGLTPCLALDMRLGEGSGCPLLFRVLEGACGVMANMATFAEAAIQDDYLEPIRSGDSFTVETI